jgi:hypothetical protein
LQQVTDSFGVYPTEAARHFRQLVSGFSITASLVADEHGSTISDQGNSSGLGNSSDLALLVALRRKSQVILTSGKTFRSDQYKFPKNADLAVLTKQGVQISPPDGQKLIVSNGGYREALSDLKEVGYKRIHVEYGLTGIRALVEAGSLDSLLMSSPSKSGVLALARNLSLSPLVLPVGDLYVGLVAWQPTSGQLPR